MHVCVSSLPVLLAHIPAGFSQVKQMEAQALGSLVVTQHSQQKAQPQALHKVPQSRRELPTFRQTFDKE